MTQTLLQTHPVKGTREFTLVDDEIQYSITSVFKKTETLSVIMSALDPEPVVSGSTLAFVSKVNREPLIELFLDRPDKETFDRFVSLMRQRITEEDFSRLRPRDNGVQVSPERLSESIDMLKTYVNTAEIDALLRAMIRLIESPDDRQCLASVADEFNKLGFVQGQVITYAPYITFMLSGDRDGFGC